MKKLSVAFFSHSSDSGGAERCLLDLIGLLNEDGVNCTVILPKKKGVFKELLPDGVGVFEASHTWWWVFGRNRWKSIGRFIRSWRVIETEVLPFLRRLDPDIIYSQTIVSPWGAYCAERLKKPHALRVSEFGKLDHQLEFILGYEDSMRLLYEKSQAVFWVSETVKKEFRKFLGVSSFPKVEETIYGKVEVGPVDNISFKRERREGDVFKVGIFGRISESKGQEDLARAALEVKNRNIKARFYLVGSSGDEYVKKIRSSMASDGTESLFEILGHQENPYQLMSEMDVMVSCSRNEAMGRTLPEAALLNIPIIFPDCGGPAEIFEDKVHGLAYSPGDHRGLARNIVEIHDNYSLALERAAQTREYVLKKFSKENYSGKVKNSLMKVRDGWDGCAGQEVADFLFNNKQAKFDVRVLLRLYQWGYAIGNLWSFITGKKVVKYSYKGDFA